MEKEFSITHKELTNFMSNVKEELITAVENKLEQKIEQKVNGKIKEISHTLEKQNVVLADIQKKIDPVLEDRRDREGWNKIMLNVAKIFAAVAGFLGTVYVIKDFINK